MTSSQPRPALDMMYRWLERAKQQHGPESQQARVVLAEIQRCEREWRAPKPVAEPVIKPAVAKPPAATAKPVAGKPPIAKAASKPDPAPAKPVKVEAAAGPSVAAAIPQSVEAAPMIEAPVEPTVAAPTTDAHEVQPEPFEAAEMEAVTVAEEIAVVAVPDTQPIEFAPAASAEPEPAAAASAPKPSTPPASPQHQQSKKSHKPHKHRGRH